MRPTKTKTSIPAAVMLFLMISLGILSSCAHRHYKGFVEVLHPSPINLRVFPEDFLKTTYRTSFSIYGRELSGLMVVKKSINTQSYRMVFLSEIGFKYFDFEFGDGIRSEVFTNHYCMEALHKDFIINGLSDHLKSLCMCYPPGTAVKYFINPQSSETESVIVYEKKTISYLFSADGKPTSISSSRRAGSSCLIKIASTEKGVPNTLILKGKKPRMQMHMNQIDL